MNRIHGSHVFTLIPSEAPGRPLVPLHFEQNILPGCEAEGNSGISLLGHCIGHSN